jgi:hypothetical protein
MQFVIISGIDGSGKTTVIEELRRRLEGRGLSTQYVWLRYNHILVKPVHALCRLIGLTRPYVEDGRKVWRHEFYRCRPFCSAYIGLTWLDSRLGRLKMKLRLAGKRPDVVVCDRWVWDILIDLAVDAHRPALLDGPWRGRFARILPRGHRQYLIVRAAAAVLDARPEMKHDPDLALRRELYQRLEAIPGIVPIDNNGPVAATVDAILRDLASVGKQESGVRSQESEF